MSIEAILMNEEKVNDHLIESNGICLSCGAVEYGAVEPDAVNYLCVECGSRSVTGMETAVMGGLVVPTRSKYPTLGKYIKRKSDEK